MDAARAAIAANRFGLGARPGDLKVIAGDPQGWLLAQLTPERELPAPLAALPTTGDDLAAFSLWLFQYGEEMRAAGRDGDEMYDMNARADVEQSIVRALGPRYVAAVKARFDVAVASETPFRERLVHFWSNHFVVSGAKAASIATSPSYERDVARAHVAGRFRDMLGVAVRHPAMQVYLDNFRSIGPNSWLGKHPDEVPDVPIIGRATGLNENLAREILELHTVGVDAGYSQADVTSFARILTGWGVEPPRNRRFGLALARFFGVSTETIVERAREKAAARPWQEIFHFDERAHEPGAFSVMGKTYPEGGVEQGEAVLDDLAHSPHTARFVAQKLCRHFIADEPPGLAVERVALAFRETDGDHVAVATALVECPEAWQPARRKFKRPEEFLASSLRAMQAPAPQGEALVGLLRDMGQLPYRQPGPDGWPDTADFWSAPDGLWKRLEVANAVAVRAGDASFDAIAHAGSVLGPDLSEATTSAIRSAEDPGQALALLLTSPEFLRR
jgi:uncharacterized protein (DUF1800 family)